MPSAIHLIEAASAYSPMNYGARGNDSADETTAFAEMEAARPSGSCVFIPAGIYRLKGHQITKPGIYFGPGTIQNYDESDLTSSNVLFRVKSGKVAIIGPSFVGSVHNDTEDGVDNPPATYYLISCEVDGSDNPRESIWIEKCSFDGGRYSINAPEANKLWILSNHSKRAWDNAINGPQAGSKCWIWGNTITDTWKGCGVRTGALTDTEACTDLKIGFNHFEGCGAKPSARQDAIDVSTANGSGLQIIGNRIKDCGDAIEVKVQTDGTEFSDILVGQNQISSSHADYSVGIRIIAPDSGGTQDHLARIDVTENHIRCNLASGNSKIGVYVDCSNEVTVQGNRIFGPDYPVYLDTRAGGSIIQKSPIVKGNRLRGYYGIYINGQSGGYIDDADLSDNHIRFIQQGIYVDGSGTGWGLRRPNITDNKIRCTDNAGEGQGMNLCGLSDATISGNKIRSLGECIRITGDLDNGTGNVITQNVLDSSDSSDGDSCAQFNGATGTFEFFDNTIRPRATSFRGWETDGGGITVLAGQNKRGVRSASPTGALAGSIGDRFDYSAPVAGATHTVCTTAGPASGGGAAVWTDQ